MERMETVESLENNYGELDSVPMTLMSDLAKDIEAEVQRNRIECCNPLNEAHRAAEYLKMEF